jgi:hypothetical protein
MAKKPKKPKKCLGPNIGVGELRCVPGNHVTHGGCGGGRIAQRIRGSNVDTYGPLQCLYCGKIVGRKAARNLRTKQQEGMIVGQRHMERFRTTQDPPPTHQPFLLFLNFKRPVNAEELQRKKDKYNKRLEKPQDPDHISLFGNQPSGGRYTGGGGGGISMFSDAEPLRKTIKIRKATDIIKSREVINNVVKFGTETGRTSSNKQKNSKMRRREKRAAARSTVKKGGYPPAKKSLFENSWFGASPSIKD